MSGRVYMGCPAHFIGSSSCVFHLATYLSSGFIVSTVGDYRPSVVDEHGVRPRRDADPPERIGFSPDGRDKYETMVFHAGPGDTKCCPWVAVDVGNPLDQRRYATSEEAAEGHEAMCRQWENPQ